MKAVTTKKKTKTVEVFCDFASATNSLVYTQVPKIAAARNAEVISRPMPLEAVFKVTGNISPVTIGPSFFVAGQMFFGRDRLEFVAQALDREAA